MKQQTQLKIVSIFCDYTMLTDTWLFYKVVSPAEVT
jgi:hypothetical protein